MHIASPTSVEPNLVEHMRILPKPLRCFSDVDGTEARGESLRNTSFEIIKQEHGILPLAAQGQPGGART